MDLITSVIQYYAKVIRKFTQNLPKKNHPEFPQHVPNNFQTCSCFPTVFLRFPNSSEVKNLIKSNFQVELSARRLSLQAASRKEKLFFLGEDVARVDGVYEMFMEQISRCIKVVGAYDGLCFLQTVHDLICLTVSS